MRPKIEPNNLLIVPIIINLLNSEAIFLIIKKSNLHKKNRSIKQRTNNMYLAKTCDKSAASDVVSLPVEIFDTALIIKSGIFKLSRLDLNVSGLNSAAKTLFFDSDEVSLLVSDAKIFVLLVIRSSKLSQKQYAIIIEAIPETRFTIWRKKPCLVPIKIKTSNIVRIIKSTILDIIFELNSSI